MPQKCCTSAKKNRTRCVPNASRTSVPFTVPSNVRPFYESTFCPIELCDTLRSNKAVQVMLSGLESGALLEWSLGRKGTHLSSRFVTCDGTEDMLTSSQPDDNDYSSLLQAHIERLRQLFETEYDPLVHKWHPEWPVMPSCNRL